MLKGAGGTDGGIGQFLIGIIMMIAGFYLLLNSIYVSSSFGLTARLFSFGAGNAWGVTTGMVMIPFIFGVGIIFYNAKNWLGWLLAGGALVALIFGVIASLRFGFRGMSAFDLIVILVLSTGGLGLFLRSLQSFKKA